MARWVAGTGISLTESGDDLTIASTVVAGQTAEEVRDTIATALVAGTGIDITPDDPGDTITVALVVADAALLEAIRDAIGLALVEGAGFDVTVDDAGNTITLAITGTATPTAHDHTAGAGDGGILTNDEHDGFSEYAEIAAPSTPAAGKVRIYPKADGKLYLLDDAGTETDLTGGGGGGGGDFAPVWIAGRVYDVSSQLAGTYSSTGYAADVLHAVPVASPADVSVDQVSISVTSAAGTLARLGIYADADGLPGALIEDFGTVAIDSLGIKTIAQSPTLDLTGGTRYWLAYVGNGAPQLRRWVPSQSVLGVADVNDTNARGSVSRTFTYAALPDPWGTVGTYDAHAPRIGMRVA